MAWKFNNREHPGTQEYRNAHRRWPDSWRAAVDALKLRAQDLMDMGG